MDDNRILIIGGGAGGIAIGKVFAQQNLPFDIVEREDDFGGNWYFGSGASRMYRSAHLISSKTNTQFSDFPMAAHYPDYPNHRLFLDYLRAVARHFKLYDRVHFSLAVEQLQPDADGWHVKLSDGQTRWYRDVVVANGILRKPNVPQIPGRFSGELLHSSDYQNPDGYVGKSVLIIGGGNSGCDIAADCARTADRTLHSTRRGYHYMPKYIHGKPTQDWLMEIVSQFDSPEAYWERVKSSFKAAGFDGVDYGLRPPDHDIHQAHPIMNSMLLYHVGHGDIVSKPDVARFDGNAVEFEDGSREQVDVVVLATGFKMDLPFLDPAHVDWKQGPSSLFLNSLPLNRDNIAFVGYFNIPSGYGNLANACGRFLASYFKSKARQSRAWKTLCRVKQSIQEIDIGKDQYMATPRHAHELDLWKYIKTVNFFRERLEAAD